MFGTRGACLRHPRKSSEDAEGNVLGMTTDDISSIHSYLRKLFPEFDLKVTGHFKTKICGGFLNFISVSSDLCTKRV